MSCFDEINVPRIFEIYNDALIYGDVEIARLVYINEQHRAD